MRSSISKSIVLAVSFAAILTVSAPAAEARVFPNAPQDRISERFRDQDPALGNGPVQRVIRIVKKVVKVLGSYPVIPIP
jgi:hypothetical protein